VSQASHDKPKIILYDVLGRIGRYFLSYTKKLKENRIDKMVQLYNKMNIETDNVKCILI